MQLRGATLLALSFFVCVVIGQATSSPFQSVDAAVSNLLLDNLGPGQLTAPETLINVPGLRATSDKGNILIAADSVGTASGRLLLAVFIMLTLLFGVMALPIDPRLSWPDPMSSGKSRVERL
jgi:hypothetical protein